MQAHFDSALASDRSPYHDAVRIINESGRQWEMEAYGVVKRDSNAKPLSINGTAQDITERKQMEDLVCQMAFHDPLTNLPNRDLLTDRVNQAMAASKRSGRYGALMFLDRDNFKSLNDIHGHAFGDLLLIVDAYAYMKDSLVRVEVDCWIRQIAVAAKDWRHNRNRRVLIEPQILAQSTDKLNLTERRVSRKIPLETSRGCRNRKSDLSSQSLILLESCVEHLANGCVHVVLTFHCH